MLGKDYWEEIKDNWPIEAWDDWIRLPDQRRGRACLRPEISRTYTFGAKGVSKGQFFSTHLSSIFLNNEFVPFTKMDLSYLLKDTFDTEFFQKVQSSKLITDYKQAKQYTNQDLKILYKNFDQFQKIARGIGIMSDEKSGIPRTGYHGIVTIRLHSNLLFIVPSSFSS